jgi:O-antigen/teichoic acid export membrane protein
MSADQAEAAYRAFRARRALATSTSSVAARVVNYLSLLLVVPLTVRYLGPERYGVWMVLLSILDVLALTNFGFGNALISIIARHSARGERGAIARYISTAVVALSLIATILAILAFMALLLVPWGAVYGLPSGRLSEEAQHTTAVLMAVFCLTLPAGLISQIRLGRQEGYVNAWSDAASSVLVIAFVIIAIKLAAGFPVVAGAVAVGPLLPLLANWVLLIRANPDFRPGIRKASYEYLKLLLSSGSLFFILSVAALISFSADNFVAAQVLGPAAVTAYAVPNRLVTAVIGLIALLASPLWPAYADAQTRQDYTWIRWAFRRSLIITVSMAVVGAVILLLAGTDLVRFWSRGEVAPHGALLWGFATWLVLGTAVTTLGVLLNAMHIFRPRIIWATLQACANIVISVFLARTIGVAGLIWGTVIAFSLFSLLPFGTWLVPRTLRYPGSER